MENIGGVNGYRCFYVCSDRRQRMVLEIVSGTIFFLIFCDHDLYYNSQIQLRDDIAEHNNAT